MEQALELPPTTIKIGIMDEERRTSVNLEACIARAAERVIFVNTGFLDRTGDEIHSDFEAGPVVRKDDEKASAWLRAYENRNVDVALRAGFAGNAQIGKGMWAQPAGMRAMLDTKGAQPKAGANTAWVPSPTAATLHALHYLETDVKAVQDEIAKRPLTDRRKLLVVPVLPDRGARADRRREAPRAGDERAVDPRLRRALGRAGHRLLDGAGPGGGRADGGPGDAADLQPGDRELAAPRAGRRGPVRETFARMAVLVDEQNASEPGYQPMSKDLENSPSFQAALELVFAGRQEPNGYTERALTHWRQKAKAGGRQRAAPAHAVLDDAAPSRRTESVRRVLELRLATYEHPDVALLVAAVQWEYVQRYGDGDATPVDPAEFAPPHGLFTVGYVAGDAGGVRWLADARRTGDGAAAPRGRRGQAYVRVAAHRGRGHARAVLAELERSAAAAGRRRTVLETGTRQPEAIALYTSCGYVPMATFGVYRDSPNCRCFAKALPRTDEKVRSALARSARTGEGSLSLVTTRRKAGTHGTCWLRVRQT